MSSYGVIMTTTLYIPVRVDSRGSINLPVDIKSRFGVSLGSTLLARQVNGVILLIPVQGAAEQALQDDRLNAWVGEQLNAPVTEVPVSATSKVATAEAIRLQASRERFEQRREILRLQKEIAELQPRRVTLSQKYRGAVPVATQPPAAAVPLDQDPMLAELRAAREADANRQLDAALQRASDEMAGDTSSLPQA
jgi:hypothetical protein